MAMPAMPAKPVKSATGTSLSGNGPSFTAKTKNARRNVTFATSNQRSAGMPRAVMAPLASRATTMTATNSGSAKILAMTPCVPYTKAAASVTKFPVTCAVNKPCRPRNPIVSTKPPLKLSNAGIPSLLIGQQSYLTKSNYAPLEAGRIASIVLPSVSELDAQIVTVMSARPPDHIAHVEANSFDGEGSMGCHRPIQTKLTIRPGVTSRLPGSAGYRNTALSVNRIGRGFPPLRRNRERQRQLLCRMDGYRGLHVDEVRIAGISCEREVVAIRKQRIESPQDIVVGVAVAGGGVELEPKPWRPPDIRKCVAR